MNSKSEHPLEHCRRWLNMPHAGFLAPRTVARRVDAFGDCYREVLMPTDFPVGDWRLIEQDGADRKGVLAQDGLNERAHRSALGEVSDYGDIEEVPDASVLTERLRQRSLERPETILTKKGRDDGEPQRVDFT